MLFLIKIESNNITQIICIWQHYACLQRKPKHLSNSSTTLKNWIQAYTCSYTKLYSNTSSITRRCSGHQDKWDKCSSLKLIMTIYFWIEIRWLFLFSKSIKDGFSNIKHEVLWSTFKSFFYPSDFSLMFLNLKSNRCIQGVL